MRASALDNKENSELAVPVKKIRHSSSLQSLRSLGIMRRSSTMHEMPVISQPTLDDTSREKVRNKIKHSPSMLSINNANGQSELHTTQHKRLVVELLQYCRAGRIEKDQETQPLSNYSHVTNLSHTYASHALQTLQIADILTSDPEITGFTAFEDVHLIASNGELFCAMNLPDVGQPLDQFDVVSAQESVTILLKVAQILAAAEDHYEFEHRHMHAGNIAVERNPSNGDISQVTLVNCDLARLRDTRTVPRGGPPGKVFYTPLDRSEFYTPRLPVLKFMRLKVKAPQAFVPATNVMWLLYLARYLNSRVPSSAMKRAEESLSPSWGGLRKAPRSAREACDRLVRKL